MSPREKANTQSSLLFSSDPMRGARTVVERAVAEYSSTTRRSSTAVLNSIDKLSDERSISSVKVTRTTLSSREGASSPLSRQQKGSDGVSVATPASTHISARKTETDLVDSLLDRTSKILDRNAANVVAYSGGVDSSLVAALVHNVFTSDTSGTKSGKVNKGGNDGSVRAVIGLSPAVPKVQIETARLVAQHIGIDLLEIPTTEGTDPTYISNAGKACLACKTHLYSALQTVAENAASLSLSSDCDDNDALTGKRAVILYNGTNADDTLDPTRLGLRAASNFLVESPLLYTSKDDVRRAAKHLGLINWNHAAAPCLRSRLAFGVEATERHLRLVGDAERMVRRALDLDETKKHASTNTGRKKSDD
mmetsp:Transcript_24115/g.35066  ORF Transcript_24115/g.35066 Transcript_24115/m.35066 type:complete len:365 (-) Transcript_24115:385-1479(-)